MAKIFRPEGDCCNPFRNRQHVKRQKQKYWAVPALQDRTVSGKRKDPLVHRTLIRIWQRLHYLSSHAPAAVEIRNLAAMIKFENRHLARSGKGTCRFINKYTAHRWL